MAGSADEIRNETKTDLTLSLMRRDLVMGKLAPGAHLKIHELQERYDVSQTIIREVLPTLANEGLLIGMARKGYLVNDLSLADLTELTELRLDLEIPAFSEAMKKGDMDWEVGILRAQHVMRKYVSDQDSGVRAEQTEGWLSVHASFHSALIAGCPSARRKQYCRHLFDQSSRYFVLAANSLPSSKDNLQEHVELGDLALSREIDPALEKLRQHINKAHENTQRFLVDECDTANG